MLVFETQTLSANTTALAEKKAYLQIWVGGGFLQLGVDDLLGFFARRLLHHALTQDGELRQG